MRKSNFTVKNSNGNYYFVVDWYESSPLRYDVVLLVNEDTGEYVVARYMEYMSVDGPVVWQSGKYIRSFRDATKCFFERIEEIKERERESLR